MSGFDPIALPMILGFAQQVGSQINDRRTTKANRAAATSQADFQIQQIRRTQEIEEQRRRERLRQALATQRSRFGGQGISAQGGSAAALLEGLSKSIDSESRNAQSLAGFRIAAINNRLAESRRRNLLEASGVRNRLAFDLLRKSIPAVRSLIG